MLGTLPIITYDDKDIRSHLDDLNVNCISCYEIMKNHEDKNRSKFTSKTFIRAKSFRVCINEKDSDKFLKLEDWPDSVVIRAWVFKS